MKRVISAIVCFLLLFCGLLSGCGKGASAPEALESASPSPELPPAEALPVEDIPVPTSLTLGLDLVSADYHPLTDLSESGKLLTSLTQLTLLTKSRSGAVVLNAASGERSAFLGKYASYTGPADVSLKHRPDGSVTYCVTLNRDLTFNDGTPLTADDVLFTYYVLLDSSYPGGINVKSVPITGLEAYRTNVPAQLLAPLLERFDAALGEDETEDTETALFCVTQAWEEDVEAIVSFCVKNYAEVYAGFTGYTREQIENDPGLAVMFAMWLWGYGNVTENGSFLASQSGTLWDLQTAFPTVQDFRAECELKYKGDFDAYWNAEGVDSTDVRSAARELFARTLAAESDENESVLSVSGLRRVAAYRLEIDVDSYSESDLETLLDVPILSLSAFGNKDLFLPEEGSFGFTRGDVSAVLSSKKHVGAGPYVFKSSDASSVTLARNLSYGGELPKTELLELVSLGSRCTPAAVRDGSADLIFSETRSDGAIPIIGETVTYLGVNTQLVRVEEDEDDESAGEASAALRRAFTAVFAACRTEDVLAPFASDAPAPDGMFSSISDRLPENRPSLYLTLPDGSPAAEGDAGALETAKAWLLTAGFVWDDARGHFVKAPDGASLSYSVTFFEPAGSTAECRAYLEQACSLLSRLGITLLLKPVSYAATLQAACSDGTAEFWVGSIPVSNSTDLYRYFHSDNVTRQNYFRLNDAELDELILQVNCAENAEDSRGLYALTMDRLESLGVCVPLVQNCSYLYVSDRIDTASVPNNLTDALSPASTIVQIALKD